MSCDAKGSPAGPSVIAEVRVEDAAVLRGLGIDVGGPPSVFDLMPPGPVSLGQLEAEMEAESL